MGNVVNRVFDSSGPEGKVRGTPQQIIDKYNQLARDAQLSNDRVATENFQQHAEHYLRMLAEALKEQAERQAQQQNQQRNNNHNSNNTQNQPNNAPQNQNRDDQPSQDDRRAPPPMAEGQPQPPQAQPDIPASAPSGDVIDVDKSESALVETPENKAPEAKAPKPRRRKPKPAPEAAPIEDQAPPPADAAE